MQKALPLSLLLFLLAGCSGGGGGGEGGSSPLLGPQTGAATVDLSTGAVTFDEQPASLPLTATALITVAGGGSTCTLSLTVRNEFSRLLFNLKAVTTSLSHGTQSGSAFPGGGVSYVYFGPEALDTGAEVTRDLVLTGIGDLTTPLTIELSFEDAPMLFGGNYGGDFVAVDASLSGEFHYDSLSGENAQQVRQAVLSLDGRTIFTADKNSKELGLIDTRTLIASAGPALASGDFGSLGGVALSPDGDLLYCAVNSNAHAHGLNTEDGETDTTVDLVVVRTADLAEVARINLYTDDVESRTAGWTAISPDGDTLAMLVADAYDGDDNELWLFDRSALTVIDADPVAVGSQPVILSEGTGFAQFCVWSDSSAEAYVGFNHYRFESGSAPDIDVVNVSSFVVTQITPEGASGAASPMAYCDGTLYYGSRGGGAAPFTVIDVAAGTQSQPDTGGFLECSGVLFSKTRDHYFVIQDDAVAVFDAETDTRLDTDGDGSNGVTNLAIDEDIRAHFQLISRY